MENLEHRISQLEAELQGIARQNRRLRLLMPVSVVLTSLPFVLGWASGDNAVFDVVQAKQIQIKSPQGKTTVLIGHTSAGLSSVYGGFIHITDAAGQVVAQLDGFTNPGGTLKLMEAGTGNTSSNTGLVQLAVERFRSSPPRGVIKLYHQNRQQVAIRMQAGPDIAPQINLSNPGSGQLIFIGADAKRNGMISVMGSDGRSQCLLEALAPVPTIVSPRGTAQARQSVTRTTSLTQTGGGGSLTLKGPTGNVIFKAPGEAKAP